MGIIRCIEDERDHFTIWAEDEVSGEFIETYLHAEWVQGELKITCHTYSLILPEVEFLADWLKRTQPQVKYRITTAFTNIPKEVSFYNAPSVMAEIEEILE